MNKIWIYSSYFGRRNEEFHEQFDKKMAIELVYDI